MFEDTYLIERTLEGDTRAFEALVNKYKNLVFSISFRMLGNHPDAEDASQESFLKIFNSLKKYNNNHKFSSWLYQITMNVCKDILRKKKRSVSNISLDKRPKDSEGREMEDVLSIDNGNIPEKLAEENEFRNSLEKAIYELPEGYKEPLILRYTENLTYEDISTILKLPIATVKVRIHRARKMIRERVRNYFETY